MVENLSSIVEYIPYIEAVGVFLNGMKYIKKYSLKIIDNYCSYSRDINEVFKSKAIKSKFDNFEDINKKHEEIVKWYNPN